MDVMNGRVIEVDIALVNPGKSAIPKVIKPEILQELSDSIKEHGMINPLIVTEEDGKYYIIGGERRWRAAQMAGLHTVPVIIQK